MPKEKLPIPDRPASKKPTITQPIWQHSKYLLRGQKTEMGCRLYLSENTPVLLSSLSALFPKAGINQQAVGGKQ
jgi:hypothetical protein